MYWLAALAAVLAFAVFGALLTGDPDTGPYPALVKPAFTPTLQGWLVVAATYYAGMTVATARLFRRRRGPGARLAISGVLAVLLLNEVWNVFLFRLGQPDLAFVALIPYSLLVAFSAWACAKVDRMAGAILACYLLWLGFDLVWAYRLADLN